MLSWRGSRCQEVQSDIFLSLRHNNGNQSTYLVFNGLDTYTSIDFCGHPIASTDNQFRQYVFDVSKALRSCRGVGNRTTTTTTTTPLNGITRTTPLNRERPPRNITVTPRLNVNFGPASNISEAIANEPGQQTWPKGINMVYQYSHREFVRKEQNDFGWYVRFSTLHSLSLSSFMGLTLLVYVGTGDPRLSQLASGSPHGSSSLTARTPYTSGTQTLTSTARASSTTSRRTRTPTGCSTLASMLSVMSPRAPG